MTKNIELLLEELQIQKPKNFLSAANKSPLRIVLEKYEDLIISGISSGHTARGFYEKLKDAEEIKNLSDTYKSYGASHGFRQHFIRVFHDYREALVQEGKIVKPASRSRKSKTPAARKAPAKPILEAREIAQPIHKPELPQAPLKPVEPVAVVETEPQTKPIIPKNLGFKVPTLDDL